MLTKKEAEDRIVSVVWEAAQGPSVGTGQRLSQSREVVRSCLEGFAETTVYIMRNQIDLAVTDALNSTLEGIKD